MSLQSCDHGDTIVVRDIHKDRECPLCNAISRIEELEEEVQDKKEKIKDLETEIESLENS